MSNETNSSNFIKNIVINDLETGKHDSIITRFPPERKNLTEKLI